VTARFFPRRPRQDTRSKPGVASRVVTWILLLIWAAALFGPGGLAVPLIQESASKLRAWYLLEFRWDHIARGSSVVAGTSGTVALVAFSDYECPFCQQAEVVIDSFTALHPAIGVGFRHVTRPGDHRSERIAIAAVCAAHLGMLKSVHDSLYVYASMASDQPTGLDFPDERRPIVESRTDALWTQCVEAPSPAVVSRLSEDSALVANLRLRQTPTFVGPRGVVIGVPAVDALTEIAGLSTRSHVAPQKESPNEQEQPVQTQGERNPMAFRHITLAAFAGTTLIASSNGDVRRAGEPVGFTNGAVAISTHHIDGGRETNVVLLVDETHESLAADAELIGSLCFRPSGDPSQVSIYAFRRRGSIGSRVLSGSATIRGSSGHSQ